MIIGRADGSGTIAISDPTAVTFNFPVTIQSPKGGTIAVNGNITGKNNASITFDAPTTNLNANIYTNEQNIIFGGQVSLVKGSNVTLDTGLTKAGDINFKGTVDGDGKLTLIAGTGIINLNGAVGGTLPLGSLTTFNSVNILTPNPIAITTTGDITTGNITNPGQAIALTSKNGNITMFGNFDTSSASTGADITLKAANTVNVNGLKAGTGNITVSGIEVNFNPLSPGSIQGTGTFSLLPFNVNGNIIFKNGINNPFNNNNTIYVGQPFQDALKNGFSSIAIGRPDGTGTITFDRAHSFQDPVTVQSPEGAIVVNLPLTGKDNASIVFNGPTTLNSGVATSGQDITFKSPVLVQNNASANTGAGAGNILFNQTVNGALTGTKDLILTADKGNITLNGAVGAVSAIGNFNS